MMSSLPGPVVRRLLLLGCALLVSAALHAAPRPVPRAAPRATAPVRPDDGGILHVDAAHLYSVRMLDAAWRYHPGDSPQFAEEDFDDSAWPLLRSGERLQQAGLPDFAEGSAWARLHLHLDAETEPLGFDLRTLGGQQYVVFANGRQIAASRAALQDMRQRSVPFAIALPPGADIVLAVHLIARPSLPTPFFPLSGIQFGRLGSIVDAAELYRIHLFDYAWLTGAFAGFVYLAFVPVALTLFWARREKREYLWLAIFCVVGSLYSFLDVADGVGAMPESTPNRLIYIYSGWGSMIVGLEFVGTFVATRRWLPIRVLQAMLLLGPVLFFAGANHAYDIALGLSLLLWISVVATYLVAANRRGQAESGLLLLPFACIPVATLLKLLSEYFPRALPFLSRFRIGHVGFGITDLGSVTFVSGIVAVVLFQFIRVSRDEQRASAELEAASTVQKVLIPETLPSLPGYVVTSAYQPAQQVGGDFFQIIPLPQGKGALIVLGDVSGKGLEAAMTVAVLVGAIRTFAEFLHAPGVFLAGLNRRLCGRSSGFTTCLILCIDASGRVTAANAGHLSPYLQGEELQIEPGLPLGLLVDAVYPESTFHLAPGQTLTLVTDGVVEASNPRTRELFGFDRTRAISTQPATFIAEAARSFGFGAPQSDDITVLTLCVDPGQAPAAPNQPIQERLTL